jgi:hypothetical protein
MAKAKETIQVVKGHLSDQNKTKFMEARAILDNLAVREKSIYVIDAVIEKHKGRYLA